MRVAQIHAAASMLLGRELHSSAIKGALSANLLTTQPRFCRVSRGLYDLIAAD
jgi:hypothetical protein